MKMTLVIMLTFAALAGAETLWENPYDPDFRVQSYYSYGEWHSQDDFVLGDVARVEHLTCWGLFDPSPYGQGDFEFSLVIREDYWGWPGDEVWSDILIVELSTIDYFDWQVDVYLDEPLDLPAATYWLEFYSLRSGYEFAWHVADNGNFRVNTWDTEDDGFFGVYGEWDEAVTEATWGAIKATF